MSEPDTLIDTVAAIAAGTLTATALAEMQLAQIAATEEDIQAWETLDAAHVRREAQRAGNGPLGGVGIGVKDIVATSQLPTSMGSAIFAGTTPPTDAEAASRIRDAGGFVFGKTVTTPFAFMDPAKTRNPWNVAHTPGGSSSGSAAAVAAGHVLAAIGTQTNGSVVRPAAYCGVVGFKPTLGAISYAGIYTFSETLDTVGTFTHSVSDAARLASVIASTARIAPAIEPMTRAPRLRYLRTFPWTAHGRSALAAMDTIVGWLGVQCEIERSVLPDALRGANVVHRTIMLFEGARAMGELQSRERAHLTPALNAALDEGAAIGVDQYRNALDARRAAIDTLTQWLDGYDAVLAPSVPAPAPHGLGATGDPSCCTLFSLLGFPAINLPAAMIDGLPFGVQLAAPQAHDNELLSVAAWCESHLPFERLKLAARMSDHPRS